MIISLISALTINNVIGRNNIIPWYFSVDMNWFKYHTINKPVIMGRKTFESIGKKGLLNRLNIVLSNQLLGNKYDNKIIIVDNPTKALSIVKESSEVVIIGGSSIYNFFLPQCTRMYLTYIDVIYHYGDSWFPYYNHKEWRTILNFHKLCFFNKNRVYNLNFKILDRCY